jgi:hypothetical protein
LRSQNHLKLLFSLLCWCDCLLQIHMSLFPTTQTFPLGETLRPPNCLCWTRWSEHQSVVKAVTACFIHELAVLHVVAVLVMFASFPKNDFFLLHRKQGSMNWEVKVGY